MKRGIYAGAEKFTLLLWVAGVWLSVIIPSVSFGQKQSNIWYFGGDGAGVDFNNICGPQPVSGGWHEGPGLLEGTATMCDSNGHLLFYTDGVEVINALHTIMPNGSNLGPKDNTVTQNIIIQKPGSNTLYYVVSPEIQGLGMLNKTNPTSASIIYSVVDMTLNGGLGDVVSARHILKDTATGHTCEKLTAVQHANGKDVWLLAHEYNNNNNFLAYLVTAAGIDTVPVVSSAGPIIDNVSRGPYGFSAIGEMKASPNGKRLAFTCYQNGPTALFDFDAATGTVSNSISLITADSISGYGITFSPDSKKLYVDLSTISLIASTHYYSLVQFDLSSGDSTTIKNAVTTFYSSVSALDRLISLKIGPDQKIYAGKGIGTYLGVINYPNKVGLAADYVKDGFSLNGLKANWSLSNAMELPALPPVVMSAGTVTGLSNIICNGSPVGLSVIGNTAPVQWQSSFSGTNFTNINGATNTFYSAVATKNIYYRAYASNGICADTSNSYSITVPPELNALYTYTQTGLAVNFNSSLSAGNIVTYNWDFGDSTTSSDINPFHTYARAGLFGVCLTIYDGSNCSYSYCGNVKAGVIGVDNLINRDKWVVYTDAANNNFIISNAGSTNKVQEVVVYDLLGRSVLQTNITDSNNPIKLDVSALPKGIYYLKIETAATYYVSAVMKF